MLTVKHLPTKLRTSGYFFLRHRMSGTTRNRFYVTRRAELLDFEEKRRNKNESDQLCKSE